VPKPLDEVASAVGLKLGETDDAWVTKNPGAIVAPATKSGRPGLRPIRRRRSSFSSADVVA
jgi:cell division cycle 14